MKQSLAPSDLSLSSPEREKIWDKLWRRTSIGRPALMVSPSVKRKEAVKQRYDFEIQEPDPLPEKWSPKWRDALVDALAGMRAAHEMPGDYYPAIPVPRFVHRQSQGIADIFAARVESQSDGNEYVHPLTPDPGAIRAIIPKPIESSCYWQAVEWTRYARRATQFLLPVRTPVMTGPIDTANYLLGTTMTMEWVYTETEVLHSLLGKITDVIIRMLTSLRQAADQCVCPGHFTCTRGGFDLCSEVRSIISKEIYEEFEAPYLRKIGEACGCYGVHSCGNWERTVVSALADPNLVAMNGQSKENDIATLCRLADGKLLLSIKNSANLHERFLWKTRAEFMRHIIEVVPDNQPFETGIAEDEVPLWMDCYRKMRGKPFELLTPLSPV